MRRHLLPTASLALVCLVACGGGPGSDDVEPDAGTAGSSGTAPVVEPAPLALAPELDSRYDCLTDLPDVQWLTGRAEGGEVGAAIVGDGDVLVVLNHQANGNLCSWADVAGDLVDDGYLVAMPSYSGGDPIALQLGLSDYARAQGVSDVVLVGASMGGTYAIGAAAVMNPAPAGVVALSPAADFDPSGDPPPVDAVDAAADLRSPLLLVVGSRDGQFLAAAEAIGAAAGVEPVVLDSSGHGIALIVSYDELRAQMLAFIADPADAS